MVTGLPVNKNKIDSKLIIKNFVLFTLAFCFLVLGFLTIIPDHIPNIITSSIGIACLIGSVILLFRSIKHRRSRRKQAITDFLIKFVIFIGLVSIGLMVVSWLLLEHVSFDPLSNYLTQASMVILILSYINDSNTQKF